MLNAKKLALLLTTLLLNACVMEQQQPTGPGQTFQQPSFHPTMYVSPGTVGGVSKSTYTVTPL